jgi:sterol desaturase/sphingolipid hydroxylase (fatty acid hydroxylase superfamily)
MLDVFMTIGNTYVFVLLLGWAIISTNTVATLVSQGLIGVFGALAPTTLDPMLVMLVWTAGIIFAYEFGYWLDHYLAHTVPCLWEFHKVHHAAEALSPLTNFRVHPIDSLVFYNILAITGGITIGLMKFSFGATAAEHPFFNFSTYMLIGLHMVGYLQHTQIWIPFTGIWGRIFMSPAHHQIHHSADQKHWDKNMGSFLSVFDWAFGTLYMPSKQREKLTFGVDMSRSTTHSLTEGLLTPFVLSAKRLPQILPGADEPRPSEAAAKTVG